MRLVRTLIVSNVDASIALEENLQDKILAGGELLLHTYSFDQYGT